MSFSVTLKSLVENFVLPRRARKGARRVGDPCRMPCRVRKEVWLEPPAGARIKKTKTAPPYFQKKIKNKRGGNICAPSAKHGKAPLKHIYFHGEKNNAKKFYD